MTKFTSYEDARSHYYAKFLCTDGTTDAAYDDAFDLDAALIQWLIPRLEMFLDVDEVVTLRPTTETDLHDQIRILLPYLKLYVGDFSVYNSDLYEKYETRAAIRVGLRYLSDNIFSLWI